MAASYLLTCTFLRGPPELAASSLHSLVIALLHQPGAPDELAAVLLYPPHVCPIQLCAARLPPSPDPLAYVLAVRQGQSASRASRVSGVSRPKGKGGRARQGEAGRGRVGVYRRIVLVKIHRTTNAVYV